MNPCKACEMINAGSDPLQMEMIHTCTGETILYASKMVEGISDQVMTYSPQDQKEVEKDQLLFAISSAINNLQKYITVNTTALFTPWDVNDLEDSSNRLILTVEVLRDQKRTNGG